MTIFLPNGAGETLGDVVATCRPLQMSGTMRFVHADTGTDDGGNDGADRENPLATLAAAVAASADNDVIILMDGHEETITAPIALIQGLTISGGGLSGGFPTVKLTNNQNSGSLFTIAADGVRIANIWFEEEAQGNEINGKIVVSGAGFSMRDCYFQLDGNSGGVAVRFNAGADHARIRDTTFISTATLVASRPTGAIAVAAAISDLDLEGVVVSSGTVGFVNAAVDASAAAITRLRGIGESLLLGANATLHASTVGYLNIQTSTGGAQVSW